jgi:hypothetical protein
VTEKPAAEKENKSPEPLISDKNGTNTGQKIMLTGEKSSLGMYIHMDISLSCKNMYRNAYKYIYSHIYMHILIPIR